MDIYLVCRGRWSPIHIPNKILACSDQGIAIHYLVITAVRGLELPLLVVLCEATSILHDGCTIQIAPGKSIDAQSTVVVHDVIPGGGRESGSGGTGASRDNGANNHLVGGDLFEPGRVFVVFRLQSDRVCGDRHVSGVVAAVVGKVFVVAVSICGTSWCPAHPAHGITVHIVVVHTAVLNVAIDIIDSKSHVLGGNFGSIGE